MMLLNTKLKKARLFIALPMTMQLPATEKMVQTLKRQNIFDKLYWILRPKWHITLAFLGDTSFEKIPTKAEQILIVGMILFLVRNLRHQLPIRHY